MMTAFSMPMMVGLIAHASPSRMITFDFLVWVAVMNFLISGAGWSLRFMVFAELIDGKDAGAEEEVPPLMRRLPEEIQSPILRLEARNHKVLVTTEKGSADIRFRMTDAIKEMAPIEGIPIHRSHWVVLNVVHGMVWKSPSKLLLVLRDGSVLPVSRSKQAEVLKQDIALLAHVPVSPAAA